MLYFQGSFANNPVLAIGLIYGLRMHLHCNVFQLQEGFFEAMKVLPLNQ